MSREVMTLALEALELAHPRFGIGTEKHKQAIDALRAELGITTAPAKPDVFANLARSVREFAAEQRAFEAKHKEKTHDTK